jgi:hypothetical protein
MSDDDALALFAEPEPELTPAELADRKLDALIAARADAKRAAERARNERRKGTRTSHRCPGCGRRTFRKRTVLDAGRVVDERCERCVRELAAWAEQSTDRARPDALPLDVRPRCSTHPRELLPCELCALAGQ